jgi:heme-binding protein
VVRDPWSGATCLTKLIRVGALLFLALIAGIQLIRPARTNPLTDPTRAMEARLQAPSGATAILHRACRDCHSNDTTWPWYSNVAPVSWLVIDHVRSGRRHFNYSDWAGYQPDKARKILHDICDEVKDGSMPVGSYTLVHHDARLSDEDVKVLCSWTQSALASRVP